MANIERGIMRLMRITHHPLEVVSVRDFTPLCRRIRFRSPELVAALDVSPTLWMRLWVPNERTGDVSQRGCTFVEADAEAGTFDVDFVLHGEPGPAGTGRSRPSPGSGSNSHSPRRTFPSLKAPPTGWSSETSQRSRRSTRSSRPPPPTCV